MADADFAAGPPPDPAPAADLAELIRELGRLRAWAGSPSYRSLAKSVGLHIRPPRAVSFRTVADVFQAGRRRLDLDLLVAVVRALGLPETEVARRRAACVRVHTEAGRPEPVRTFRQLPADLATFTGRVRELADLMDAAASPAAAGPSTVVISAIDGMAGIGKSALAVHAAHLLADRFPDGQLFLDLQGYAQDRAPSDPADALASLLASLGVPPGNIPAEPGAPESRHDMTCQVLQRALPPLRRTSPQRARRAAQHPEPRLSSAGLRLLHGSAGSPAESTVSASFAPAAIPAPQAGASGRPLVDRPQI